MRYPIRKRFTEAPDFGPLRMRLQRFGQRGFPFYNIVVAQARFRRNGRYHDVLGTYTPCPTDENYKHVNLDFSKVKQWLAVGASPTSLVASLLSKAGLLPTPPSLNERIAAVAKKRAVDSSSSSV